MLSACKIVYYDEEKEQNARKDIALNRQDKKSTYINMIPISRIFNLMPYIPNFLKLICTVKALIYLREKDMQLRIDSSVHKLANNVPFDSRTAINSIRS